MPPDREIRPAYKSLLVVAGVILIVLGVGNWIVGAERARPYAAYLAAHPGPLDQSDDLKADLLQPPDEQREERSVSRAKLDFYGLVRSGGRLMVVLGAVCLFVGILTLNRVGRSSMAVTLAPERRNPRRTDDLSP